MVRVGGGYFRFDDFIPSQHRFFEKTLLMHMIKSKESLEWVCDALCKEKKIPQVNNPFDFKDQMNHSNHIVITRRLAYPPEELQNKEKQRDLRPHLAQFSPSSPGRKSTSPGLRKSTTKNDSPGIARIDLSGTKSNKSPSSSKSKSPIRRSTIPNKNWTQHGIGPHTGLGSPE